MLGESKVNIATFHLGRDAPGGEAIALVEVDQPISPELLGKIAALEGVVQAKLLEFLTHPSRKTSWLKRPALRTIIEAVDGHAVARAYRCDSPRRRPCCCTGPADRAAPTGLDRLGRARFLVGDASVVGRRTDAQAVARADQTGRLGGDGHVFVQGAWQPAKTSPKPMIVDIRVRMGRCSFPKGSGCQRNAPGPAAYRQIAIQADFPFSPLRVKPLTKGPIARGRGIEMAEASVVQAKLLSFLTLRGHSSTRESKQEMPENGVRGRNSSAQDLITCPDASLR